MRKKDLTEIINSIFASLGYKKKGNTWVNNQGRFLNKIINIQRSNYSESYYINYGFIIKQLYLSDSYSHVSSRLGSINHIEQNRIQELLNFENKLLDEDRRKELVPLLKNQIEYELETINTEDELTKQIRKKYYPGAITLRVKSYLNLPDEWVPDIDLKVND